MIIAKWNPTTEKYDYIGGLTEVVKQYVQNSIPKSLPANGGNADTVNGHTVEADVPSGAKFTDTTYPNASATSAGLVSTGTQTFGGTKIVTGNMYSQITDFGASSTAPTATKQRFFKVIDKNNKTIADISGMVNTSNISYAQIRAVAAAADVETIIYTAVSADGTNIRHQCTAPSNSATSSMRQLASGTAEAYWNSETNSGNCPNGAWYGRHD